MSFSSFIPMILDGAGAMWQMGAQDIGTKNVTDMYVMPYSYGAPSQNVGMYSGMYAGGASKKTFKNREEFTDTGKWMNDIGILHNVAMGDASQVDQITEDTVKSDRYSMYQQWAGDQASTIQGAEGLQVGKGTGTVLNARPIQGPSHTYGGVDLNLNGLPVEAEGGEILLSMDNGSKVVLNQQQQARYGAGEPIESIMQDLPKYSPYAQSGDMVPNDPLLFIYDPEYPEQLTKRTSPILSGYDASAKYEQNSPKRSGYTEEEWLRTIVPHSQSHNNTIPPYRTAKTEIGLKKGFQLDEPHDLTDTELINRDIMRNQAERGSLYTEPVIASTPEEKSFTDQYNENLKMSTALSAGNAFNQGLQASLDILINKRKPKPPRVGMVGYSPTRAILENPQPYIDALLMANAARIRMGREAGMLPAELAMLSVALPEGLERIQGETAKINTGRVLGTQELNSRNFANVAQLNAGIAQRNIAVEMEDDKMRTEAYARSRDVINKAMSRGASLFGEYSQNKLYADIISQTYSGNERASLLTGMHSNKYYDTPSAYPDEETYYTLDANGNPVPVK